MDACSRRCELCQTISNQDKTHTMNTSITLKATKTHSYILNGVELSKADLGLLLEMNDLDVIYDLPDRVFYIKCLQSLPKLDAEEFFTIFNDFISYTEEEKNWWRQIIHIAWAQTAYSNPN